MENVADLYRPLAEEKGIAFDVDIDFAAKAWGDSNLIAQTIANLTDNAIKYSPGGGSIHLKLERSDSRVAFEISDTGPGIPEDLHEKVFERLYRLESSRTSQGSGLGLSLVAAVAKSHGLTVKLTDNVPGLNVTILFPNVPEPAGERTTRF